MWMQWVIAAGRSAVLTHGNLMPVECGIPLMLVRSRFPFDQSKVTGGCFQYVVVGRLECGGQVVSRLLLVVLVVVE